MTQNLTEFFREKKIRADAETSGIDWNQRRDEWLGALDDLYLHISRWLSEPIHQKTAELARRRRQITEQHLGTYSADDLVLSVGDENVLFAPKGRNIIGAIGRVDVQGESGEAMLVLQPDLRWALVTSKYPVLRTVPLDETTLGEALRAVMRK